MALVVPNDGEVSLLQKMLNQNQTNTLLLKLFSNNYTPSYASTLSELVEVTTTGYTNATVTNSNWTVSTPSATDYAQAGYPELSFTFSASSAQSLVYGYYVTDTNAPSNLLWLERFTNAPFTVPAAGGNIGIILTINLENV
jgi:hypothetical protein